MESTSNIWNELRSLRIGYDDLRKEIANITNKKNEATQTSRRGALTTSGVTAEQILKNIYRREGKEIGGKPAEKMMLDELISELTERSKPSLLPHHVVTHLRTVQAWRNLGGHDKGDFSDVDDDTLIGVYIALNTVVSWFFESYLGGEFAELAVNNELKESSEQISKVISDNERVWQDYFWFVNRNVNIRPIESSYLSSLQVKFNISDNRIILLKEGFQRKVDEFSELLQQALEDEILEVFELEAIEHSRKACCISIAEAKSLTKTFIEEVGLKLSNKTSSKTNWLDEIITESIGLNDINEIDALENNDVIVNSIIEKDIKNEIQSNSSESIKTGDFVCCIKPFQTIIDANNVLVNSGVIYSVNSIDSDFQQISLLEFSPLVENNRIWFPKDNFISINQLPTLESQDIGSLDKIVCCFALSDFADVHALLQVGGIYTVSSEKKEKGFVTLVEFPQENLSEKKKWFQFDFFRFLEKSSKFGSDIEEIQTDNIAEIDLMVTTINVILKSYKGDKKKWVMQYKSHELFPIASAVLNGKIRNSEIKDSIISLRNKKKV